MARPVYYPTRKMSKIKYVPFGYKINVDDPQLLEPIVSEINMLRKAVKYVEEGYSYQTARDWLVANTGREITTVGFWKICKAWKKIRHKYVRAVPRKGDTAESAGSTEDGSTEE